MGGTGFRMTPSRHPRNMAVIPAQAGIQVMHKPSKRVQTWAPACAGATGDREGDVVIAGVTLASDYRIGVPPVTAIRAPDT